MLEAGRALVADLDLEAVLERVLAAAAEIIGARTTGFGLGGMREWVELLGGEPEIASGERGTRVSAVLPTSRGRR